MPGVGRCPRPTRSDWPSSAGTSPRPARRSFRSPPGSGTSRRRRRLLGWAIFLVLAALCAGAIAQWVRPIPDATVQVTAAHLPGSGPTLVWPSTGEAAVAVEGLGSLGQVRGTQAVPVAGLAQVLTAYVVLSDHPLATGDAEGPSIPVTTDTLTAYQAGLANQESEVPVPAGESLPSSRPSRDSSSTPVATWRRCWPTGTRRV